MIEKAITASIILVLILLVFYWATTTVETQIQSSEFTTMIYSFQILSNFDDGAFREGDANYVVVTITRGRIDNYDHSFSIKIYINDSLVYEDDVPTKIISYRGGWLTSAIENFYRGSSEEVTTSSVVFSVYTNQCDGARVYIKPRVRVFPLGVYVGRRIDGSIYKIYMVNVYIPSVQIGECYGGSPYHLVLRTNSTSVYVLRLNYPQTSPRKLEVRVNGYSIVINTPEVDSIIITIVKSIVLFEIRGV